jgi:hypothetical protein
MRIKRVRAGFIVPVQPILASRPPSGSDEFTKSSHDGYLGECLGEVLVGVGAGEHIAEHGIRIGEVYV